MIELGQIREKTYTNYNTEKGARFMKPMGSYSFEFLTAVETRISYQSI